MKRGRSRHSTTRTSARSTAWKNRDGITALVLELVEGPTLADRLERGPLPVPDALAIARQIAEALEAAHEKGIVHRDLKPANIVLTGEAAGDLRAKVLDFGLAKAIARDSAAVHPKETSSSFDGTADGRVLGTPAYMSPEQARGQTVDHRTDVWAFGCVLYEMLTGRPPFEGDTMSDTFVSILERDPDWVALPAATPASVRRLLERCLRKDPRKRLHDIADAILDIDDAATVPPGTSGGEAVASSGRVRVSRAVPWLTVAALAVALARVGWLYYSTAGALPTEPLQLTIHPPEGVGVPLFALSPDGRYLAFVPQLSSNPRVWVHSLVTGEAKALPLTEGARGLCWKPDSQEIAFFVGDKLKTVALLGGSPIAVASIDPSVDVGTWGRSNVIIVPKPGAGLQRVSATGGTMEAATVLTGESSFHRAPVFLPDGVHFLYLAFPAASTGPPELRVGSLESKEMVESLGPFESNVAYAGGYLFFVRGGFSGGGNLMARPFDPERRRLGGVPVPLGLSAAVYAPRRLGAFSVSAESGRLVYLPRVAAMFDLTWHNRGGQKIGTVGEPGVYAHLDLSPDDTRVAVSLQTQQNGQPLQMDIWTIEVKPGGGASRVTEDPASEADPAWSGDGRQLAFNSDRPKSGLFVRSSDGSGKDVRLLEPVQGISSPDWSVDNKHIVYMDGGDLWTLPMTGDRKPAVFANTAATEKQPVFSADSRWVAYVSDRSSRDEVYIRAFPRDETVHQVSREGGWTPRWRHDGRELFFLSPASKMMAVSIDPTKGTALGAPRELFPTDLRPDYQHRPFDVTRDGERFLVPTMRPSDDFRVVLNWRALLPK